MNAPCPCCGYCPTCGRRNLQPYYPVAPYPGPIWIYPNTAGGAVTIPNWQIQQNAQGATQ